MSLPSWLGYEAGQPPSPPLPPKALWPSCREAEEAEELRLTGRSLSEQTEFTEAQLPKMGSEAMLEPIPPSEETDEGRGAMRGGREGEGGRATGFAVRLNSNHTSEQDKVSWADAFESHFSQAEWRSHPLSPKRAPRAQHGQNSVSHSKYQFSWGGGDATSASLPPHPFMLKLPPPTLSFLILL